MGPVGVDYARELLGEALVEVLIAKGTDVTTVYSAGRHVPKRIRSALLLRDPRCVVPNCDARLGLENDHWVTDFAKGGLTALDNLARLCRRHHLDRTHRGFELTRTDGRVGVDRPRASDRHPSERRPKRRRRATAPPPGTGPPRFDRPPDQLPLDQPPLDRGSDPRPRRGPGAARAWLGPRTGPDEAATKVGPMTRGQRAWGCIASGSTLASPSGDREQAVATR